MKSTSGALELVIFVVYYNTLAFIAILTLLIVIQGVRCYLSYQIFRDLKIKGPKPALFVGNNFQIRSEGTLPHLVVGKWLQEYGNVFGFYMGSNPVMVIKDVEIIKEIMVRKFEIFPRRPPIVIPAKPFVDSVMNTSGDKWKSVRGHLTPAFSTMKMKLMNQIMSENVDTFVEILEEQSSRPSLDIFERCQALTLQVISECVLALNVNCQRNPADEFLLSVKEFFHFSSNPIINLGLYLPFLAKVAALVNDHLTCGKMTGIIMKNLQHVIRLRRENWQESRIDMLQLMLNSQKEESKEDGNKSSLTDIDIIANSHLFLLAGYETTSTALTFTFYLLALHPNIQERLYEELKSHLADKSETFYDDIKNINYLEQIINESLRLYPPIVFFLERVCDRDCVVGGIKIPKGMAVHAPIWQLHRDPELWTNPDEFNPDRFSPENRKKIPTGAYLPFGIGPRTCAGMRFAILELKLALAKVLLRFKILRTNETEVPLQLACSTVIINPKNGIKLKLQKRT